MPQPPINPSASKFSTDYIAVGTLKRAHGIQGEIRLELDNSSDILDFTTARFRLQPQKGAAYSIQINTVRQTHDAFLVTLEGVGDRTAAETLSGTRLEIHKEDITQLENDNAYLYELLGAKVFDQATDQEIGEIVQLGSNSVQPLLVIQHQGREVLHPLLNDTLARFDRETKQVWIHLIPGLLDA